MKAACIQLRSGVDIKANIDLATDLIREAAANGARLIATPEMTHIVQRSSKNLFQAIKPEADDIGVREFSSLAADLNIFLLIGSLAIQTGEKRAVNRSYLFGPDGKTLTKYDKIHLFDVQVSKVETWKESAVYDAGDQTVTAQIDEAKLGLSICYDLRFPHLYRHYAKQEAHILTVPAAFTRVTGEAHWKPLLRARAIETGCFVLAPAQGGVHEDGRETYGHSLIIDPWGKIIAELDHNEPGIIEADLDLEQVHDARRKIPAWNHEPPFRS